MSESGSEKQQDEETPSVIVIGLQGKEELHIIEGVLNNSLPPPTISTALETYKWIIDNKYYTAEVNLCKVKEVADNGIRLSPSICKSTEALIIYIDSCQESALHEVDKFLTEFDGQHLDVKLLVCDSFTNNIKHLAKDKAQEWCIDNGWELVELSIETSSSDHEDDLEDDFVDSFGFTRIRQALNAHTWSNLCLKGSNIGNFGHLLNDLTLHDSTLERDVPYEVLHDGPSEDNISQDTENIEVDDYCSLFSILSDMKEKAESLPPDERKNYAEKVAMTFLKALGDDESDYSDTEAEEAIGERVAPL